MDSQVQGCLFKDKFVITPTPSPDIQDRLTTSALLALPYISLWVGIDARIPTKAVYALYDPEIACLRFVHGDGSFVGPERVCFRSTFKDKVPNLNQTQRLHFMELINRSVQHHRDVQECAEYRAMVAKRFDGVTSVKSALTFVRDIKKGSCPALSDIPVPENFEDHASPTISLTLNTAWDFEPFGFQAYIKQENDAKLTGLHEKYLYKYGSTITPNNFQHALFCLAGLMEKGLISFVLEGQNDRKYFLPHGVTPPRPWKLLIPRRTSRDWTVDCFVARFMRFEKLFNGGYESWPNPIAWLEAEMDREEVQRQQVNPWKLVVENGEKEPRDPPIIDWETLQSLKWYTRGDYSHYPKSMSQEPQPLELHDIVDLKTFKFRESTKAKKYRKERENAAKKTTMVGLTDNSTGHMNRPAVRRDFYDIHSGYTRDDSELLSPSPRKRKHIEINQPQSIQQLGTNGTFLASEQLQHPNHIKQENAVRFTPDDDLYDFSDREEQKMKPQSKRARYQSPPPIRSVDNPAKVMKSKQIKDEQNSLYSRTGSKSATTMKSILGPAQKPRNFGSRREHTYFTSSPGSDSDIEIIETPGRHVPTALKSPSQSPNKVSTSSSFTWRKRNSSMQDCLDVFERQHKIPRGEFDKRYYERLHSPSSSPEQKLYPSIQPTQSFSNNSLPPKNKSASASTTDGMVIDLESPEPEVHEVDDKRGAPRRSGMISFEIGHRYIDMTDGMDSVSSGTLSDATISRNGESMEDLRNRIASFQVASGGALRRKSF